MADQPCSGDPQAELVARVARGDSGAFRLLLRPHERTVFLVARVLCAHDREAETLAEQGVLAAFRELTGIPKGVPFAVGLAKIVLRESGATASVWAEFEKLETSYTPRFLGPWQEISGQALEDPGVCEALLHELMKLPKAQRLVLVLHDMERFTAEEAAWVLGAQPEVIHTHLRLARLQMRDALAAGVNGSRRENHGHPNKKANGDRDEMRRSLA
jgi:RNA polymerase sigma-70 factor (ECF subfamily)